MVSVPNDGNQKINHQLDDADTITVGRLVEVASRTWPGINKPGGVARVVEVHFDASDGDDDEDGIDNDPKDSLEGKRRNPTHVNVRYILGSSREKRVPLEYVQLAPQFETRSSKTSPSENGSENYVASSLRDRSMLLGRCRRCGSLRSDCGSCDWAMEEEAAVSTVASSNANTPKNSQKSSVKRKKDGKRSNAVDELLSNDKSDDDESSESSSGGNNDDMARWGHLIRQTRRRRRHRQSSENKRRSSSSSRDDDPENSITENKKGKSNFKFQNYGISTSQKKWQRRYPVLLDFCSSSSSDSSDSEVAESNNSKRAIGFARSKRPRESRRNFANGKSVLESLPTTSANTSNHPAKNAKSLSQTTSAPLVSTSKYSSLRVRRKPNDIDPPIPSSPEDLHHAETSFLADTAAVEESLRRSFSPSTQSISYEQQLLELEARARFQIEQQQQQTRTSSTAINNGNEDVGFIQPEGQEAIENLPEDVVDLSRSIPYKDLGTFFDEMVNKVEDEILPDVKLTLASLHRRLRIIQKQNQTKINNEVGCLPGSTDGTRASAERLLQRYHQLWDEVRLSVIHNGTDQCRATLRRLMDDKLYRKHRKHLTVRERKRCRGAGVMDSRNLRMDAIDDTVEAFIRKLKDAVILCESECANAQNDMMSIGSNGDGNHDDDESSIGGAIYYSDDTSSSSQDDDLDLLPIAAMAHDNLSSLQQIVPFTPHEHASRAKQMGSNKRKVESKELKSSTSKSSKNHSDRTKKRTKITRPNKIARIDPTTKRKPQSSFTSVSQERANGQSESNGVSTNLENSINVLENSSEEDDHVTSSVQNEIHAGKSSSSRRRNRVRRGQLHSSSGNASLPVPRDPKRSISERMQAFLDANIGDGTPVDSEKLNKTVQTGRQTNQNGRMERQFPIFEPGKGRKDERTNEAVMSVEERVNELEEIREEERRKIMPQTHEPQFTSCGTCALFTRLLVAPCVSEESSQTSFVEDHSSLDESWEEVLADMEAALSNNPESMNSFLRKAFSILINEGSRTIQEMISSNDSRLSLHIRTLCLCIRSLQYVRDDELPIIFTKEKQDDFLNFVVLQMVDALYSLNLPSAWALDIENMESIIQKLIPLRNALGLRIPLLEAVSRCIINTFGCQNWRKSRYKNHTFVSSLDPKFWFEFLQSGRKFENPQVTRFKKLGRHWPRIETDALWRILAFISSARSSSTDESLFRFQIISKLFSSGVFAVENIEAEDRLPPSEEQILACQREVGYLSILIRKGVLNCMPKSDSMLVKLVQYSLQLQSDSYRGNDLTRASCIPGPSDDVMTKKVSPMFWGITHPLYFDSSVGDHSIVSVSGFPFDQCHHKPGARYRKLLYPSSDLLTGCLSLVVNWITHVSPKKVRQNRLTNSLKALQNYLLKEANQLLQQPAQKVVADFEDAFSVKPSVEIGIASERVAIFKKESASYLQVISLLSSRKRITPELSRSFWNNMSDDQMKRKQSNILARRENSDKYAGDAYRLFATVKIMATLLLAQVNISPWHLSLGKTVSRLFTDNSKAEIGHTAFAISCIFACLDCLCDVEVGPHLFSQVYEMIILVFANLTATIKRGEIFIHRDHVYASCFYPVLIKCVRMHLTSSKASQESFHLGLCLSLVRSIHSFSIAQRNAAEALSATVRESASNQNMTTPSNDNIDDMWGELNDSDFADLDLTCIISENENQKRKQNLLWYFLSDALDQSKPSKRYAILGKTSTTISDSDNHLSSIGKFLVAQKINEICGCFATAIASSELEDENSSEITNLVSKWIEPSYENDEDYQYSSKIARKLTSELCLLAEKFPRCKSFVFDRADNMILNFLKELVNSSRLEKLPSSNLERIGEISGKAGTKQALHMLDLFNDISFQETDLGLQGAILRKMQNRRRKHALEIWNFCSKLGSVFLKNLPPGPFSTTQVGRILLNLDSDLTQKFDFSDRMISLENEVFKIFRLLRNFVSFTATNDASFVVFERISSCSLLLLANHVIGIVQSLKYNDQTSSDREYKKARLSELLSSFVELFVSLSAWIIREGAKDRSTTWSFLQTYLRDRLFSPILRNQPIDSTIALQEVAVAAKFVLDCPRSEGVSLPTVNCVSLVGCSKYLDDHFLTSILRRSKQLLIATALNPQNLGLQNAILEAVMGSNDNIEEATSLIVGTSFPLGKSQFAPSRLVWPYKSSIEKQIDDYLNVVEENFALSLNRNDRWRSMAIMNKSFLKNHLLPRLNSSSMGIGKKRRILLLFNYMLEYDKVGFDTYETSANILGDESQTTVDLDFVRDMVKAVRLNIHECLMQYSVDNNLARIAFSCSTHLASKILFIEGREQNLISWSREKVSGTKGKTMLDLSNSMILSSYVWVFFKWLEAIGDLILNQSCNDSLVGIDGLTMLRKHWQRTQCCRHGGMDEEILDLEESKSLQVWDRMLLDFEDLASPSSRKESSSVINVYAKPAISHPYLVESKGEPGLSWEEWMPSTLVRRSLKELMAVILSTL